MPYRADTPDCLTVWVADLTKAEGDIVAIDGKTSNCGWNAYASHFTEGSAQRPRTSEMGAAR